MMWSYILLLCRPTKCKKCPFCKDFLAISRVVVLCVTRHPGAGNIARRRPWPPASVRCTGLASSASSISPPASPPPDRPAATRSWLMPTRAECPEIIVESMPARVAMSFRRRAISPASRGDGFATPFLRIARNTGPEAIPAPSSQARNAAVVLGDSQRTAPAPSWSVLERAIKAVAEPSSAKVKSSTVRAAAWQVERSRAQNGGIMSGARHQPAVGDGLPSARPVQ
jgi:hypothetical protein